MRQVKAREVVDGLVFKLRYALDSDQSVINYSDFLKIVDLLERFGYFSNQYLIPLPKEK